MTLKTPDHFLAEHPEPRPWQLPDGGRGSFEPVHLFLGQGDHPLEIALASTASRPNVSDVRQLWKRRKGNRPAPVLLVVLYPGGNGLAAAACGPAGDDPPVISDRDPGQVERIAATALREPNRNAAIRFLAEILPETESDLPGIRNTGMFSTHALRTDVPSRDDWRVMSEWGRKIVGERGRDLIRALGFDFDQLGASTSVLRIKDTGTRAGVAVFLDEGETPDGTHQRFGGSSPVSHALAAADTENLPFVVMTRGSQIRVYAATKHTGVGRKGRTETFVEANLSLLPGDLAGYLPLLFGAPALQPEGTFSEILELSGRYASELGARLRDRVYDEVVPKLARVVAAHHHGQTDTVSEDDLDDLYETAMVILFRILFVAYAEDKDLLPYRSNGLYQRHALKTLAQDLSSRANENRLDFDALATNMWSELGSLWRAINRGNSDWDIPPYNGGMFSDDPEVSPVGARIADLEVTNAEIGPALAALLVDRTTENVYGPVDFRSLSVGEFGTIYEGLLESSLSVAPTDLTRDSDDNYVPVSDDDEVDVTAGHIYLHNRSGARKATGSYFTKPFAVEHLLEHALDPALDDHLERIAALIDSGDESAAAEQLFDFRVADIAMGSGHFLVAAVDHVEARLSTFLADHPIPRVLADLQELRRIALENLGELADAYEIEDSSLLRRHVARRCIYGVDLNLIAVELARLAIWIHTFVPGLPLSFLDHNLVRGDSLTGIGTIDEALDVLAPDAGRGGTPSMLRGLIEDWLGGAKEHLKRLARLNDATTAEVAEAREAHRQAQAAVEQVRRLFDLLVAIRLDEARRIEDLTDETLASHPDLEASQRLSTELNELHFPVTFPEVFLRELAGFDCLIGNPPWEKVMPKADTFYALRFPGLKSLPVGEMNRRIEEIRQTRPDLAAEERREEGAIQQLRNALQVGPYPELGRGHPDLYKAFAWRFLQLTQASGTIGVVLPRSSLSAAGSAEWREEVLEQGSFHELTILINRAGWVFDDAEHRYTIGLVSIHKGVPNVLRLRGPFRSLDDYRDGVLRQPIEFSGEDFAEQSSGAALPLLPTPASGEIFASMRRQPRLDSSDQPWRFRPVQGDFNSTTGKKFFELDPETIDGLWPVYGGASFNLWTPDTGEYYAWADPEVVLPELLRRFRKGNRNKRSAFSELDPELTNEAENLPCMRPRISYRKITRSTDTRTVIACLIPDQVITTTANPYLLRIDGDEQDEAFLLGVMCSIPFDWFARRYVEINLDFHYLNSFPVPLVEADDERRQRIIELVGALCSNEERLSGWTAALWEGNAASDVVDQDDQIAELDAVVSSLYNLEPSQLRHVFETFHEGWNPGERMERALSHLARFSG